MRKRRLDFDTKMNNDSQITIHLTHVKYKKSFVSRKISIILHKINPTDF